MTATRTWKDAPFYRTEYMISRVNEAERRDIASAILSPHPRIRLAVIAGRMLWSERLMSDYTEYMYGRRFDD